jgi:hypothetical protein
MRKTTSIKIEPEIWGRAKKKAIDAKMHVSEYTEIALQEKFKKDAQSSSSASSST